MSERLTPQREAEIDARAGHLYEYSTRHNDYWDALAGQDVPALLAELAAVRSERNAYRERALDAENRSIVNGREVCADCGRPVPDGPCGVHSPDAVFQRAAQEAAQLRAERDAARARVAELEAAQQTSTVDDDASDNRRRLYIDGKGNGWISVCHDEGTEWVVPVQPEAAVEQDIRDVADETGSLREIGRCW